MLKYSIKKDKINVPINYSIININNWIFSHKWTIKFQYYSMKICKI